MDRRLSGTIDRAMAAIPIYFGTARVQGRYLISWREKPRIAADPERHTVADRSEATYGKLTPKTRAYGIIAPIYFRFAEL
jgi:hypothetical protein